MEVVNIYYLNGKYNFDYLDSIIKIIMNDYKFLKFDISYDICFYDKITNFVGCAIILLLIVLSTVYHYSLINRIRKSVYFNINLLSILLSTVLCVVTMVYFEKLTQLISLEINCNKYKLKLLKNIFVNVAIFTCFNFINLAIQMFVIYLFNNQSSDTECNNIKIENIKNKDNNDL